MQQRFQQGRTQLIVRGVWGALAISVVCVALCLGGAAQAKGSAQHPGVHARDVTTEGMVAASATATFAAQCPHSDPHPVGGEFGYLQGGSAKSLALAASYPNGRRGWVVTIKNLLAQPQAYYAAIVCVRAKATFSYPRKTFVISPNGGVNNNYFLKCPRKTPRSINIYFGTQSPADIGSAVLSDNEGAPVPDATIDDVSSGPVGVFGGAVCTSMRRTIVYTAAATLGSGMATGWIFRCPRRTLFAVSGSFYPFSYTDAGLLETTTTALYRNGHKWVIDLNNLAQHPIRYLASAVCVG